MSPSASQGGRASPGWVKLWSAVAAGALLAGCSGAHEPPHMHMSGSSAGHASIAPTTDVPALLGVTIDGLRRQLGTPRPLPPGIQRYEATGVLLGTPDSIATFQTGGLLVIANYDAHSRQVRDLLLLGHHEDSLMARASLRANATTYLVMPVFHKGSPYRLLGLRVIATK